MRVLWAAVCLTLCGLPRGANAQPCGDGGILLEARRARRIVSNLELMEAHYFDEHRRIRADLEAGAREDPRGLEADLVEMGNELSNFIIAGAMRTSDAYSGFKVCRSDRPLAADLDRTWWGVYERVRFDPDAMNREEDDSLTRHLVYSGVSIFFLRAIDGLVLGKDDLELDYAQTIFGVEYEFGRWVGFTIGGIHDSVPEVPEDLQLTLGSELERGWSFYLAAGVPELGLSLDVVAKPGVRGIDVGSLELRELALPWLGLRLSSFLGYFDDQERGVLAIGVSNLLEMIRVQAMVESGAPWFRFARVRIEPRFERVMRQVDESRPYSEPVSWRLRFEPFVEGAVYSGASEDGESQLAPGGELGLAVRASMLFLAFGAELHVGVNRPRDLLVLPSVADRVWWGTRFFFQLGI